MREQQALFETKDLLYYGDNLTVLRRNFPDESVDLVYLDPPFKSGQKHNLLFTERDGTRAASQEMAFEDTWEWNQAAWESYQETVRTGPEGVSQALQAFRKLLGTTDMLAYLSMMAPRLVELRRVLRRTGSIYLHCDPTASHYLKLLMDAVFGAKCFRNEIIWSYRRWPSPAKHYQRMHDVLLFYAADPSGPATFNVEYEPNSPSYVKRFKGKTQVLDPETKTRKLTVDKESKGLPRRDVWELSIIAGFKKERVGFPTQKPESLLDRIIRTSSNKGDTVLDPFCGCGTTVTVAKKLERRWIGIDITPIAIEVMKTRLERDYGEEVHQSYEIRAEPASVDDALVLAGEDKYEFQWWVLRQIGAARAPHKKGADQGIDGRVYFHDQAGGETRQAVISVKGGATGPSHVRDLRGVMEREQAAIGVLVTIKQPTRKMLAEAAEAGAFYSDALGHMIPRLQILTVEDLLADKSFEHPGLLIPALTPTEASEKSPARRER